MFLFLQELSQKIGDDKSLSEHLQLPIQRINDYQLLLKVSTVFFLCIFETSSTSLKQFMNKYLHKNIFPRV